MTTDQPDFLKELPPVDSEPALPSALSETELPAPVDGLALPENNFDSEL